MSEKKETSPPEFDAYEDVLFQGREVVKCDTEVPPKPEKPYRYIQNFQKKRLKK